MNRSRTAATLAALASLALPLLSLTPAHADVEHDNSGIVRGADGQTYPSAPVAVPGRDGQLFYGADFDSACTLGNRFVEGMDELAKLGRIIERSGRTVVWTLGLNKTSVYDDQIDRGTLPHGRCDKRGLLAQAEAVRAYDDPRYLPLADKLAGSRRPAFFRTDPHWSSVGGSVFAKALATRLSRKLGKIQRYTYGSEQRQGMLNDLRGIYAPETAVTALPASPVTVTPVPPADDWAGYPSLTFEHTWTTGPKRRTHPGHTLLLGDSFMMFALDSLRPLFRHGHWMWYYRFSDRDLVKAIVRADTVVLEVYQLFVGQTEITEKSLYRKLRRALR